MSGVGIPDVDLTADVLVAVVLTRVGHDRTGSDRKAGSELNERNHVEKVKCFN